MRPGDNVYFFCNRTVYGIGEILGVPGKSQAAFEVEPDVATSKFIKVGSRAASQDEKKAERWGIAFKPVPYFLGAE